MFELLIQTKLRNRSTTDHFSKLDTVKYTFVSNKFPLLLNLLYNFLKIQHCKFLKRLPSRGQQYLADEINHKSLFTT